MNKSPSILMTAVITAILLANVFYSTSLKGQYVSVADWRFYHPADSTIYFCSGGYRWWEDDSPFGYVFRLKDDAHRIERSPDLMQEWFAHGSYYLTHDNIAGRLYSEYEMQRLFSENGGDDWSVADSNYNGINSPGENPGEAFRTGRIYSGESYRTVLYSTTDSWRSMDTSYVIENWNSLDNIICFTRRNGHLIRFLRAERNRLEFSSDTGRTWVEGDLNGELIPLAASSHTWVGAGDEFYRGRRGLTFWCISDSGREIREVFNFCDHGPYNYVDNGGFQWDEGYLVTTPNQGEFYAIIDSTSWDSWGIKMDIYHCWDYGERIEMLRYYMPNFEPCDPQYVNPDVAPLPETTLLNIFPNPTNGGVTFHLEKGIRNGSLRIYDITGRFMGKVNLQPSAGQTIFQLDLQSILGVPEPSGIYPVVLNADGIIYYNTVTFIR